MKIKELSELSNIEVTSIKQLVKDKGVVYAIGVDVGSMPRDMIRPSLSHLKNLFSELGVEAIIYPIGEELEDMKFYKLEKSKKGIVNETLDR